MSSKVTNVADFIQRITTISLDENAERFYRGQGDKDWGLNSGIYRTDKLDKNSSEVYSYIENEDKIIKDAFAYCASDFNPSDTLFDRLVKLQHYGYKTRLLDITSIPLVALYFAVSNEKNENDAKVAIIDIPLEEIKYSDSDTVSIISALSLRNKDFSLDRIETEAQNTFLPKDICNKNKTLKAIFNAHKEIGKLLHDVKTDKPGFRDIINPEDLERGVCVKAKLNNIRISRQQGAFLLYGINRQKMEQAKLCANWKMNEIIIDKEHKHSIRKQLETLGFTKQYLFPELESQAKFAMDKWKIIKDIPQEQGNSK